MRVSKNYGYLVGCPHNKDYSILGSILGSPYLGKLPYSLITFTWALSASNMGTTTRKQSACRVPWLKPQSSNYGCPRTIGKLLDLSLHPEKMPTRMGSNMEPEVITGIM